MCPFSPSSLSLNLPFSFAFPSLQSVFEPRRPKLPPPLFSPLSTMLRRQRLDPQHRLVAFYPKLTSPSPNPIGAPLPTSTAAAFPLTASHLLVHRR